MVSKKLDRKSDKTTCLFWNDVFQPRKDEDGASKANASHHGIDFVDDLLQIRIIVFQFLTSNDVPQRIQDGNI